jgi:hypothetical protein
MLSRLLFPSPPPPLHSAIHPSDLCQGGDQGEGAALSLLAVRAVL